MRRRRRAAAVIAVAVALAACGRERLAPPDAFYTTRGQVIELPTTAGGELTLRHEAVAGFRDRQGKPSHMDSMTMPFAVGPTVSLDGVASGDKVSILFEVRWSGGPPLRITKLEKLPGTTTLTFGGPTLKLVKPIGSTPAPH